MTSNQHPEIVLDSDQVRVSLPALAGLLDSLDARTLSLLRHLEEAQRGDPHKYLSDGISEGYDAAGTARRAAAELREVVTRVYQTLNAFDQHDQSVHSTETPVELPKLNGVPATLGLTASDMSLSATTARSEEVSAAVNADTLIKRTGNDLDQYDSITIAYFDTETGDINNPTSEQISLLYSVADGQNIPLETVSVDESGTQPLAEQTSYQPTPTLIPAQPSVSQNEQQKSWWDRLTEWFSNFWNKLDERVRGVLRAIGIFALGIVFIFAIAGAIFLLLVAAGVSIAFGTVLLVVGLIILAAFFGFQLGWRFAEMCDITGEQPWFIRVQQLIGAGLIALGDITGITGIIEAYTGKEILNQEDINQEERWYRGTLGFLTIASLFLGRSFSRQGGKKPPLEIVEDPKVPQIDAFDSPPKPLSTKPSAPEIPLTELPNVEPGQWKIGDPINKLLPDGSYPSWEISRSRYWMNRAENAKPGDFSPQNIGRMRNGSPPVVRVRVRMRSTGEIKEILVSKEIHHINGRSVPDSNNPNNLQEVWPWEHEAIDPERHIGYEFIEFIK